MEGDGGAVGLAENHACLRHWMVSGPEMARLIQEFEGSTEKRQDTDGRPNEHNLSDMHRWHLLKMCGH